MQARGVTVGTPSRFSLFLANAIEKSGKTQREIANDLGYDRANIVSMFKSGDTKIPLEKLPALADSLRVDVAHLLRLWLEQYWTNEMPLINRIFSTALSKNELRIIEIVREVAGDQDLPVNQEQADALREIFGPTRGHGFTTVHTATKADSEE